jgi:hypothetical protein
MSPRAVVCRLSLLAILLAPTGCAVPRDAPSTQSTSSPAAPPTPTPEPSPPDWLDRTPSPECVTPPHDLMTVIFQADPVACYGDADLEVEGIVQPIGVIDPRLVTEPKWLGMPRWTLHAILEEGRITSTTLASVSREVARPSTWSTPDLWIVAHPTTGVDLANYEGRAIRVVGHFDDQAARTCHFTEDYSGLGFSPDDAVRACRYRFVVVEVEPIG